MNEYNNLLNTIFSDIVRKYNKFQLSNHTKDSLAEGYIMVAEGMQIINKIKMHAKRLETILADCQDFVNEIEEDLTQTPPREDFVYATKHGMLSYLGRDFIEKKPTIVAPQPQQPPPTPVQQLEKFIIPEIKYGIKLPVVKALKDIPSAFYYYKNDEDLINTSGIYMNFGNNNYIKIPFPTIIDSSKDVGRDRSIRCKYKTRDECNDQRDKMAKFHNSTVRQCNFAHVNDKIVKIGYLSRCSDIPNFGNPATMPQDIKKIDIDNVKNILLYGLNDAAVALIWMDYHQVKNKVFSNLEIA